MSILLDTVEIWLPLSLILLGYFAGRVAEKRHYASIHERERIHLRVPVITSKTLDDGREVADASLATGSVVISIDAYKRLLMGLRGLIGGEVKAYTSLIDRARREALLRMRESAPDADLFINFRLETTTLYSGRGSSPGSVEILAYATAVRLA
jgi:uncharacterized protein YbjQ (UPF0145 family)